MDAAELIERAARFDEAFAGADDRPPSWREGVPAVSLELLGRLGVRATGTVADVGGGDSTLADELLARGFDDVIVVDLSDAALARVASRLGVDERVTLVRADAAHWRAPRPLAAWHDRACLHFLTAKDDRRAYLEAMAASLSPGGGVVLGCFAPQGPASCSGLAVRRASCQDLAEELGERFEVLEARTQTHVTPWGAEQPFSWVAARLAH